MKAIPEFDLYGDKGTDAPFSFLHVEEISKRSSAHDFVIRPHVHRNLYQILLVDHGLRKSCLDGKCFDNLEKALIFAPPGVVHSFEVDENAYGFVATCSDDIITSMFVERSDIWFRDAMVQGRVLVLDTHPEEWRNAFDLLRIAHQEQSRNSYLQADVMRAAIEIVFIIAIRHAFDSPPASRDVASDSTTFGKLLVAIERGFRSQHSVEAYANQLGISPLRLNKLCRARKGLGVKQLIARRVIQEAKRLLIYSSWPVSELAYELGFKDHAYFSRVFKAHTGESPKEFRETHKANVGA